MLDLWYKNTIIYSLNVGTYKDSNGDGIGDFRGLINRLDHLAKLGVTCLWLMPFFPSPMQDYGYDVTDYYSVASRYGTLGDFVELSRQARQRGFRLLIDLPINHTSNQHPWFQQARSDRSSPYRDYYFWSDEEPANRKEGVVFTGIQESVWSFDQVAQAWYFHRFYKHQPDLDHGNPQVREEIQRIMGFWLELGVSGFRIDAAPFLVEEVCPSGENRMQYDILERLREFLSWRRGDAIMLAEANISPAEVTRFICDTRVHMAFAFFINQHLFLALARQRAEPLERGLSLAPDLPRLAHWAQFLRNHDELDLGRLSEEERAEVMREFAPSPEMHLYERGIRRRLAPMLGNDRRRIELANSLTFSLPGAPVIYYGEEIGMGDDLSLDERWPVRTCMQWLDGPSGGFSSAPPERLIHPIIHDGPFGTDRVNVMAQQREPSSLLNWFRQLCDVRQSCPEIGWGRMSSIATDQPSVFAHRYIWNDRRLVLLHNLGDQPCKVTVNLDRTEAGELVILFGDEVHQPNEGERCVIELAAYGYRWFRVRRPGE